MTSLREERLEERRREIAPELVKARRIAEKAEAEHRDMTPEEREVYDPIMVKGREVADALAAHRHDQDVWAVARELSDNVTGGIDGSGGGPAKGRRLSFKGMGHKVAGQMLPDGSKALAPSGAAVVGQEFRPTRLRWGG